MKVEHPTLNHLSKITFRALLYSGFVAGSACSSLCGPLYFMVVQRVQESVLNFLFKIVARMDYSERSGENGIQRK